jgi:hypothetical protein
MPFADWCGERAFQGDVIFGDGVDGLVWDYCSAVFDLRGYVDGFPLDRDLGDMRLA